MTRLINVDELLKHHSDHEMISTHLIYNAPTVDAVPVDMIKGRINDLKKMLMDTDKDEVDLIWHLRTEIETLRELLEMWEERNENDNS